ncbi:hypothetical protein WJX77_002451 [Trebouxia sp. C0004]
MCSLRCSICLESAKDKQDETGWAVLGCGHVFHAHCLQQSLEHKKACPNCRKGVKSAKGAQALFLDLVPAMPMTPLGKGNGPGDNRTSFASQEAVTALAETLAKRDAELKQHLMELRQTQDALKQQSELCAAQEEEIAGIQHQHQRAHKIMEEDLVQKRKQVLTLKQSIDKQSSSHKLRCDKLVGQVSRLQTDYDRLSLRNDLGLTKCELEQIAKRMAPPSAKGGALVNYWVGAVDARNREYAQLMRKFQVEANLHDASKSSLSEQLLAKQELLEKVAAVKQQLQQMQAKQEQQSTEIQTLKAQLAVGVRRTESAVQSGAVSSRGAAGLPPGRDLHDNRDQCGAANSDRAAGNGSRSTSMIRWDATEDQMPAAMRLPPSVADRPRKSLSLRERMTMHLPQGSSPQPFHLSSHESAAQPAGQVSSPDAGPALACANSACDHGRHQQSLPSCLAAEDSNGAVSHSATAADERSARAGGVFDACLANGDAGAEDLTQEDLPALPLPSNSQEEHDSPLHSKIHEGLSAGHPHDRHVVDRRLQMAEQEPDQQIDSGSRIAHNHLHRQQQQQDRLRMQDGKECGQEKEAASACQAQQDTSKVQHPDKTEPHVINLEDESVDDLLDALADAAAEVPKAADDATDEGLTTEEFDPHSKVSRLHMAAASIALQRSSMAAELPPMRTATTGLSGTQRGSKQEPSFARTGPASFGHRGQQSGDFIVRGADGRGGRATVLRPSNRQAAPVQPVPSFLASGVGKGSKLPVKRKATGSGSENLKIRHFFAPSHS